MTTLNSLSLLRSLESQVEQLTPTGNDIVLALPSASNMLGKIWTVINSGTAGNILVQSSNGTLVRTVYPGTTGQVTPNINSPTLATHWEGIGIVVSNQVSYTPALSISVGIASGYPRGTWYRTGGFLFGRFQMYFSSGSSGYLFVGLPTGLTLDLARVQAANVYNGFSGSGFERQGTSGTTNMGFIDYSNNLTFPISFNRSGDNDRYNAGLAVYNTEIHLQFSVPIVGWSATKG